VSQFRTDLLGVPRDVVGRARQALRPPPRLTLSEWAERNYRLSADAGAAEPGRWSTIPFQREPMDAMTDPRVESVTWFKSARVGYTECIKALIGYHVEHDPCPLLVVQPTEDDAKGFSKESIDPLIRDCRVVGERFTAAGTRDTMLLRRFRGGILQIAGARSPGNFRRVSRRVVISDELDGYPASAGKEGDPRELAEKRAESFWNRKFVRGSTATHAGASRIEQLFFEGDQRRYYVPCPHCEQMQVLLFNNLKWPPGQPELAQFECIHCSEKIDHAYKRWMVEHGEWRPGPHPQFPKDPPPSGDTKHRSFHIWTAYSFLPNATWAHIAAKFLEANRAGQEALKTFVNTWLGETWKNKGEAPDWERLYQRRETYARGTVPMGALFLTCAVDVQPNLLIYEVVGWGRDKESWSLDADVVPGDTSDLTAKGPWPHIDALLDRTFEHEAGQQLKIRMMAIDSGNQTQTVYSYVRLKDPGRVMAVKGSAFGDIPVTSPSHVDVAPNGNRIGTVMLWHVGVSLVKGEIYGWLNLRLPTDEERAAGAGTPPGYCHFPEYGEDYFKQITAEQLVEVKDKHGFTDRVWERIPGRENHYLDVRVYNRAAAWVVGLDRSKEKDWAERERILGIKKAPGEPPTSTSPPPAPAPPPKKPGLPNRSGGKWIDRRRGGWLKDR
jgi:phage terminase large subunit GpA-like protein